EASAGIEAPLVRDSSPVVANRWKMPPFEEALGFHFRTESDFARLDRNGYVKSVDQVAGFLPHALLHAPVAPVDDALAAAEGRDQVRWDDTSKRWKVARVELVSLLKHETPRVYLSDNLPRMEDLSSIKTRPLSP